MLNPVFSDGNIQYAQIPTCFDIETSSFYDKGEKRAIMYLWNFAIDETTFTGRYWSEFIRLISYLVEHFQLNIKKRIIIYIHNLQFEFQFMRHYFTWYKVFAVDNRKPLYAITNSGIEFRCSYLLSGLSLKAWSDSLPKELQKRTGWLDYSLIRHSATPLTAKEIEYGKIDVLSVSRLIKLEMERNGGIENIPLTKTGYARRLCRQYCFNGTATGEDRQVYYQYHKLMSILKLTPHVYELLRAAFMGGFTHANFGRAGKVYRDVASFDFNSSYPAIMVSERFPMSQFTFISDISEDNINDYLENYACLFTVKFNDLEPKIFYEHYISESKCILNGNYQAENGRIIWAEELIMTLTEQDFTIIERVYKWKSIAIRDFHIAERGYLPKNFVKAIFELYRDKTLLKDERGKEEQYLASKGVLNSTYGMCVTSIVKDILDYVDDWKEPKPADITVSIKKHNCNPNRFLYYAWGVWITAYARRNLWSGIFEFKQDYIYSDTDSLKVLNYKNHMTYINNYNKYIQEKIQHVIDIYKFPSDWKNPKTIHDVKKPLGVWEFEAKHYSLRFKTLGAKRYLCMYKNFSFEITVAGLPKYYGVRHLMLTVCNKAERQAAIRCAEYDKIHGTDTEMKFLRNITKYRYKKIMNAFSDKMYVEANDSGKNVLTYLDKPFEGVVTDYLGNVSTYREKSAIHVEPTEFTMSLTQEYLKLICGQQDDNLEFIF